jgi:hypothetical protein
MGGSLEGDGVDKSMPPKGVGQTNGARSPAVSSNREQPRLGVSMLGAKEGFIILLNEISIENDYVFQSIEEILQLRTVLYLLIPPAGVSSHRLGVTPDVPAGVWSHRDSVRADCGVLSQREHLRSLVLLQEFDPNAKGS